MKVIITGINGFIGRVLLEYLLKYDNIEYIYGVDNLSNSVYESNHPLLTNKKVQFDICSVNDKSFNPKGKFDYIYHLASPVGPVGVIKWAGYMGPMIVEDTLKMAQIALNTGAKLIDISTSEVYGKDPEGIPQIEDLPKNVPSNVTVRLEYGVAKLLCEVFLTNLIKTTNLQCNILRPYNIVSYGQQAAAGFVLPRFIEQAKEGVPMTVYQPGTQRRTFTHVRDFVEAMIAVMEQGKNGEIYNVGNPLNLYSIMELAIRIKKEMKSDSLINIVDPVILHGPLFAEAWEKIPDITKIQNDINWKPFRTLENIIEEAVNKSKGKV